MSSIHVLTFGALIALVPALPAQGTAPDTMRHTRADTMRHDSVTVRAHTLPPVRVVAEPTRRADAASSVVISPQAIRTAPATNAWDIVRQTAGIEVHQQGQGPGFASDAVIRGFTSDHSTDVALIIDGVPINQPVNGHAEGYADWNQILPEAVSSIRVLKGPASPWIGNFAMGGEVEVQSVPAAVGTQVSLRTGSYGDARISLLTGNANESGGWAVAGDGQREDGWRPNSRSSTEHLYANRTWGNADSASFSLGVRGYGAQWDSPGFLTLHQFDTDSLDFAVDRTDGGSTGLGVVRAALVRPAGGGKLESMLYGQASDWHLYLNIPPEGGPGEGVGGQTEEIDRRAGAGGYTRWSRFVGSAHVIFGVDYRATKAAYQRYFTTQRARDSVFTFDNGPARLDASYLSAAPTVEAHWDATPALSFGVGGRLDWLRYASQPWDGGEKSSHSRLMATPKLSALYRLTPVFSAYAAFNGGFRSPEGIIADPSAQPLRAWASEIGVRAQSDRFEGGLALFNVDVHNEQSLDPLDPTHVVAQGHSRRRGIEADARFGIIPAVALFTHATVNDAKYLNVATDEGEPLDGADVFGVARATVEGGADFQWRGAVGSIWAAYTGPFTPIGEPDVRTSGYALLDARGVIPVAHLWSIAVGIQNILDKRYPEVRASGFVSPGQPRTVLVTVRRGT
jgi:outer membrane cobalamin receptor